MGLINLLEKRRRLCRLIFIRMKYNRQPSICTLDILRPRLTADTQYFIIVLQLSKLTQKLFYEKVVARLLGARLYYWKRIENFNASQQR